MVKQIKIIKIPNLFIVGAPKAGTTSLYRYLQTHSNIFFSEVKEPHFFNTDTNNKKSLDGLETYLELFKKAKNEKYLGEASTHYLMSDVAAKNINQFSREAKIIIMLRKPSDLIYSAYYQNIFNGTEDAKTLEEALSKENNRDKNDKISHAETFHLIYSRFVCFKKYVENYYKVFGKENVLIIFFKDFKTDTEKEYNRVLKFLSLEKEAKLSFKQYNSSKKTRSVLVRNLLKKPPKTLVLIANAIFPKYIRKKIVKFIDKKNTNFVNKEPISPKTEKMLVKKYIKEVEKLEQFLTVDLSHWKS